MAEIKPLVSVVIAAYNAEAFIHETIEALLNQTYQNFEIVVVNDGSTDRTGIVLDEYAKKDSRLKVFHNATNMRVTASRNTAIALAKGDYIAINDADDIALPEKLEKQVRYLENNKEYSFVGTNVRCFYDASCQNEKGAYSTIRNLEDNHFNYMSPDGDYAKTADMIKKGMITTNRLCHSSVMGRAPVFKELKYKDVFAEDWELFVRALINKHKITKIPEVLVHYRIVSSGLSGDFSKHSFSTMLTQLQGVDKEILKAALKANEYLFLLKFVYLRSYIYIWIRLKVFFLRTVHATRRFFSRLIFSPPMKLFVLKILGHIHRMLPTSVLKLIRKILNKILHYPLMRKIPVLSRVMFKIINVLNANALVMNEAIYNHIPAYNIGIWTIEEKWLMGGLYTVLKMAAEIIKKGNHVRFINYGLNTDGLKEAFKHCLQEHYALTDEEISRIEIIYFLTFRENYTACHRDDRYIAGYWCPAEDIQKIHKKSDHFYRKNYAYIIQDYEPHMLYRWGSDYVRSYNTFLDKNYYPLFNNSEFVCSYLKKLGLVDSWKPYQMLRGEPCKTEPPSTEKMRSLNDRIRLVFYSRPSVDKNIYEIKIEAIKLFIDALESRTPGILKGLVVTGIGETAPSLSYKGVLINNLGKLNYKEYPEFIQNYNIGLACIVSPAFAYPCLEFPRAGLVTVVNRFETRDLEKYSANILSCDTSAEGICEKLLEALDKIKDVDTRQKASKFELPGVGIEEATVKLQGYLEQQKDEAADPF